MADYKKMYVTLLDEIDQTIERLKVALDKAGNIYIHDGEEPEDEESKKTNHLVFILILLLIHTQYSVGCLINMKKATVVTVAFFMFTYEMIGSGFASFV